jgi:glutamine amidotransferase
VTVAIIDSGGSNLRSVAKAIDRLNKSYVITDIADEIMKASFVILPGVGSAEIVMNELRKKNLVDVINNLKQPVLGICIGMQILFEYSAEGNTKCLGLIEGDIQKFDESADLKVPQMGWNKVTFSDQKLKKFNNYYYFANSYYSGIQKHTTATSEYGDIFTSVVEKNNLLGCQFHPEKSSEAGEYFLQYFFQKS